MNAAITGQKDVEVALTDMETRLNALLANLRYPGVSPAARLTVGNGRGGVLSGSGMGRCSVHEGLSARRVLQ
jgi:hypothetical protein